ncbi:hypothetical protein [Flavobacterium sp. NRK F7]|uniref:hypothetical protein n=1 Tax=Flavobacterium sp. NRK F7 TaxID=2954930 RepID=UPI002090711C|nr:hypothetical protein [Flavobacterium sp. NRK F7]MCO6164506.1 hypothetical protein [Flavobacterium sp. NRK F7]
MEFLDRIDDIITTEQIKIESFIKKKFKEFKSQDRKSEYAIDKTRTALYETFIRANFIDIYRSHFETYYNLYKNSVNTYDNKQDAIKLALQNEMYEAYPSFKNFSKISNVKYCEEFDNLTFENFVKYLLQYDTSKKIEILFSKNSHLYILFYDNNYNGDFYLKPFEGHVVNSSIYKKLHKKFYPNKFIPYAKEETDEFNNTNYIIITEEIKNSSFREVKKVSDYEIHDFDINEQALLLNLCLSDKNSIPLTEKIKILILIGEIKDKSIFEVSPSINPFYNKVNKGILRKGSIQTMIDIVDIIFKKFDDYDLNITKQRLKIHKTTLLNEQNKTKK